MRFSLGLNLKKEVKSDRLFLLSFLSLLFTLFLQGLILIIFYRFLPPKLPLFYSRPWGEEQLASKNVFLILPIILLFLFWFNSFWANLFYEQEKILARIFFMVNFLLTLLLNITFFKILFLIVF